MEDLIRKYAENHDDLNKAIEGLIQFRHNYCMNCAETDKQGEPVFRCSTCAMRTNGSGNQCCVKIFINVHGTEEQIKASEVMS